MTKLRAALIPSELARDHATFTLVDASNECPLGYVAYNRAFKGKEWMWAPLHETGVFYRAASLESLSRRFNIKFINGNRRAS